jgi:hypothetical protein
MRQEIVDSRLDIRGRKKELRDKRTRDNRHEIEDTRQVSETGEKHTCNTWTTNKRQETED